MKCMRRVVAFWAEVSHSCRVPWDWRFVAIRRFDSVRRLVRRSTSRFHTSDRNGKSGVATPKRDNYIELVLHPRYKNNISRYVRVIGSIALRESAGERVMRIESLQRQLLEPTTAARAALQLEALGEDAAHVLLHGLESPDPESAFLRCRSVGLPGSRGGGPRCWLKTAMNESAFRWHALTALGCYGSCRCL